jgi:hypothetical protein
MIKIGDKVKFLNDVGGGVVTRFLNKNLVMVENYDGFEIPYPVLQLLNTSDPELNIGSEKIERGTVQQQVTSTIKVEENKGIIIKGKDSPDFNFCIVPVDAKNPAKSLGFNLFISSQRRLTGTKLFQSVSK